MSPDRRTFLRRCALLATGTVAADQLEILERLTWTRTVFPSAAMAPSRPVPRWLELPGPNGQKWYTPIF